MSTAARLVSPPVPHLEAVTIGPGARHALIASWLGWLFDGFETYALVLVMGTAVHQLLPSGRLVAAPLYIAGLLSATLLGWAVGGVIAGVLTDYIGRRRMLMLSVLWYAAFTGLTALSGGYWALLAFRFLVGLGLGAEWGPGAAIVAELWPPASRGRAAATLHAAHGFGFLLALSAWLLIEPRGPGSWRWMFVVGVAPAFLLLYVRRAVQEPELWVAADARRREARARIVTGTGSTADREAVRFTLAQTLSRRELRQRVGLLFVMSLASVVGWWSASKWIPLHAVEIAAAAGEPIARWKSAAELAFVVGSIAGYLAFGVLADRYGRKPSTGLYFLGALGVSWWFFLGVRGWYPLLAGAAANGFFASGQFAWMTAYLPELFPTRVRGSATSLVFDSSRAVAAAGPLLAGALAASLGGVGRAAPLLALVYLVGLAATPFAGPETRGTTLPD